MKPPQQMMPEPAIRIVYDPKSVLMLEDDTEFSEVLRDFLQAQSFRVQCVSNGAEGVRQILDKDFDIILCDLVMPHLPGDMFYLALQRTKPQLCQRLIFMSGHQANPKWDKFVKAVKTPVLWKPFLLSDLLTVIEGVLAKNAPS